MNISHTRSTRARDENRPLELTAVANFTAARVRMREREIIYQS